MDRRYVTQEIEIREEGEVATVAGYGAVFDRKSQPLDLDSLKKSRKVLLVSQLMTLNLIASQTLSYCLTILQIKY